MISLRTRLLLAVGLVIAAGIGAVGYYSSRVTQLEFQRFANLEEETLEARDQSHQEASARLEGHYRRHGGWAGAAEPLEALSRESEVGSLLILIDAAGSVVVAGPPFDGQVEVELQGDHQLVIEYRTVMDDGHQALDQLVYQGPSWDLKSHDGEVVGRLFIVPTPEPDEGKEGQFLGSVNRGLWIGVLVAGALALLLTAALSQRILGPIGELTAVVRRMEGGELSQRVSVRSTDELGQLARAFNSMAESLARTEELRRNMVSDVAHELRTPLTNIRGQLEAVQDGLLAPDAGVVASLHEEVMLLSGLVDDLQDLALADAGQLRFEIEEIDLGDEIRRAVEAMGASTAAAITLDIPQLPPVRADARRLAQIVRNLLQNAVRHTPEGGEIVISAGQRDGEGGGDGEARVVEVSVRNSGAGIAPEHLPYVFERFYRTDPSRHHATGGAGLGLAIVKQLVEAQGGRVAVRGDFGSSCTFSWTLPSADSAGQ